MGKEIETIEEFFNQIFVIQEDVETCNRSCERTYHTGLAFRGQASIKYELIPSIGRNNNFCQERNLVEMAKYKLPHIFRGDLLPIDLLSLLQHFGVPTRLLDVTSNPLVALYFATLDDKEDGELFIFEYNDSDLTNYPIINGIAESYKFAIGTCTELFLFFDNIIGQPYFSEQLNMFSNDTREMKEEWIKNCCKDLLFVRATEQLERQKLQQGFYILFPNEIISYGGNYFHKVIRPINKNDKQIKERLIIKKNGKREINYKLRFLGISEATLFADNIDIVCKEIVEQCRRKRF